MSLTHSLSFTPSLSLFLPLSLSLCTECSWVLRSGGGGRGEGEREREGVWRAGREGVSESWVGRLLIERPLWCSSWTRRGAHYGTTGNTCTLYTILRPRPPVYILYTHKHKTYTDTYVLVHIFEGFFVCWKFKISCTYTYVNMRVQFDYTYINVCMYLL